MGKDDEEGWGNMFKKMFNKIMNTLTKKGVFYL